VVIFYLVPADFQYKLVLFSCSVNFYLVNNTHLREIGWDGVDWVDLAQDRDQWRALVNMVMNLRVP
jgi:hypothetical protein